MLPYRATTLSLSLSQHHMHALAPTPATNGVCQTCCDAHASLCVFACVCVCVCVLCTGDCPYPRCICCTPSTSESCLCFITPFAARLSILRLWHALDLCNLDVCLPVLVQLHVCLGGVHTLKYPLFVRISRVNVPACCMCWVYDVILSGVHLMDMFACVV